MNIQQLRNALARRITLHANDDIGTQACWDEMIDILSENITSTLNFFNTECADEEFYWISEIFEDIAERTQSKELIDVLYSRLATISPENHNQKFFQTEHIDYEQFISQISVNIDYAKSIIQN